MPMGGDWADIQQEQAERGDETLVINMGPQHPATHGVLRLILETEGETVKSVRPGIGFLHTGIEKNMEFRNWAQGSAFVTRMDYVAPIFNEVAYCLSVERLLGIEDKIPERATQIRVLMMELNRISNHLVAIGTTGNELGATSVMMAGFREREMILDFFEAVSGVRMNHAYIRPGGVAVDLPENGITDLRNLISWLKKHLPELALLIKENPIFKGRTIDVGVQDLAACMAMGVTGPLLRSAGYGWDLRKTQPYCGYETYDFDVPVEDTADCYGRYLVRYNEMWESLKIVEQVADRLEQSVGQPVMYTDAKISTPADLKVGPDGQGNSHEHIKHIMGESMEALIHHFKVVTEGFRVPAGQAYVPIEGPKGEIGCHIVSDGGTRPYRAHMRDPGFNHLQSVPLQCEGGMISDVIMALASIDPVMGGVDR
ncbi:NADH-quinone oxidoreductase subunit D [Propioniciclava sp. MC1595]|uniref:NADH-quinone oxidoreductase subunit D n=1 Tax=Propioniciclava sp. MC1595 TaxID=2760308 RepID=UPI0016622BBB|nr:NADH-quinone oxidoreductase subunit D [Propioniciclava sp. MC1595]MBB1493973.1 NADH-quinone oxidoreductase subunit D [Propioniciclava sp. MC1595]QTE27702.1 NADH-quinone oxidoreductase subunit D [Propioniciclava sp. MC1595]